MNKVRCIAFYLPQYHPIPENDKWWGKGFTEWTNVAKAKPLFPGHYQPKIPADLGFYDLRVPETRVQQAELAKDAGIEGFCYWHYWFGDGKQLLERPFDEVVKSGKPDFPFCLGWANHSWYKKTWEKNGDDELLIEQTYLGKEDYVAHFNKCLAAFLDKRYIKIDGKPIFLIWEPIASREIKTFISVWNEESKKHGFEGIYFIGFTFHFDEIDLIREYGFSDVVYDSILDMRKNRKFITKAIFKLLHLPAIFSYRTYMKFTLPRFQTRKAVPCLLPNFDHSPRSGRKGCILLSTPKQFGNMLEKTISIVSETNEKLLFIKSWNEWGEGNYLEPDLKYGHDYLEIIKKTLVE